MPPLQARLHQNLRWHDPAMTDGFAQENAEREATGCYDGESKRGPVGAKPNPEGSHLHSAALDAGYKPLTSY